MAAMGGNVDSAPVPKSAPVEIAHELLQAGFQYLDVRYLPSFFLSKVFLNFSKFFNLIGLINISYAHGWIYSTTLKPFIETTKYKGR